MKSETSPQYGDRLSNDRDFAPPSLSSLLSVSIPLQGARQKLNRRERRKRKKGAGLFARGAELVQRPRGNPFDVLTRIAGCRAQRRFRRAGRFVEFLEIAPVPPPGLLVDTTGAGDAFYAGLIAGLARGMNTAEAGRLAAAAGACCVTGLGATAGLRAFEQTWRLVES